MEAEFLYDRSADDDDEAVTAAELMALDPAAWADGDDHPAGQLPAIVATLQAELARMADSHVNRMEVMHGRLEQRMLELERMRAQAIKATVLAEKAAEHARRFEEDRARLSRERDALAQRLDHERAVAATERQRRIGAERYASMMSVLPWYAWRRRRDLRQRLDAICAD